MEIVEKNLSDIVGYKNNPRNNKNAIEAVANSIREFGFKVPIVIDKDNVIVCGHTRAEASKLLGLDKVPCIVADDLSPEQIKAFRLADNKVSEQAEWDFAKLDLELLEIENLDMSKFGFDLGDDEDEAGGNGSKMNLESMELKAFEHYDYLVFVFDNQMDWLNAVNAFGLHKVDAGYGKTKKVGVGRVLRGTELVKRIEHPSADNQQEQVE